MNGPRLPPRGPDDRSVVDLAAVEQTDQLLDRLAAGRFLDEDLDDPVAMAMLALTRDLDAQAAEHPIDLAALVQAGLARRSLDDDLAAGPAPAAGGPHLRHARPGQSVRTQRMAPLAGAAAAALLVVGGGLASVGAGEGGLDDVISLVLGTDAGPAQQAQTYLDEAIEAVDRGDDPEAVRLVAQASRILASLSGEQRETIEAKIVVVEQRIEQSLRPAGAPGVPASSEPSPAATTGLPSPTPSTLQTSSAPSTQTAPTPAPSTAPTDPPAEPTTPGPTTPEPSTAGPTTPEQTDEPTPGPTVEPSPSPTAAEPAPEPEPEPEPVPNTPPPTLT